MLVHGPVVNAPLARQGYLSQLERSIWQFNQWWLARLELVK